MVITPAGSKTMSPSLRPKFLLACIVSVVVGVAGFYGGHWWANYEAQKSQQRTIFVLSHSQDAKALFVLRSVLEDLRADRVKQGETKLLRYAKLQANSVVECRKSKECMFWAGQSMLTEVELNELRAMKERQ